MISLVCSTYISHKIRWKINLGVRGHTLQCSKLPPDSGIRDQCWCVICDAIDGNRVYCMQANTSCNSWLKFHFFVNMTSTINSSTGIRYIKFLIALCWILFQTKYDQKEFFTVRSLLDKIMKSNKLKLFDISNSWANDNNVEILMI